MSTRPRLVPSGSPSHAIRRFRVLVFGVAAALAAVAFLGYRLPQFPAALGLGFACALVIGFLVLARGLVIARHPKPTWSRLRRSEQALDNDAPDPQSPSDIAKADQVAPGCGLLEFRERLCAANGRKDFSEWRTRVESSLAQFNSDIQPAIGLLSGSAQRVTEDSEYLSVSTVATLRRASHAIAEARQLQLVSSDLHGDSQILIASTKDIETKVLSNCGALSKAARTIEEATQTINGVASKATQIAEIAGLIQSVSAQTCLLALNAMIAAARAGDSGKDFAIVAREVKMLANQALRAAQSIREHVAAIQFAAAASVEANTGAGATTRQPDGFAESITAALHRHAAVAAKVAHGSSRSAANAMGVAQDIEDLNISADAANAATAQLRSVVTLAAAQAKSLHETIDRFLIDAATQIRPDMVL